FIVILCVAIFVFYTVSGNMKSEPESVLFSEVTAMSQNGEIRKIEVDGDKLTITRNDGTELISVKESNISIYEIESLNLEGVNVDIKDTGGINWGSVLIQFLPLVLIAGLLYFLF